MANLQQDLDELDRMVDTGAAKENIRSQIRFIAREVAALEQEFVTLFENHQKLQAQSSSADNSMVLSPKFQRGLYYVEGDAIPFCPNCKEHHSRMVHLSGPVKMVMSDVEYWECHSCDKDFSAKPGENFLTRPSRPRSRSRKN